MAGPAARRWWQLGAQFPRLPTVYDAHQRAVPRLPIPTLEESCAKYLRHLAPLQSAVEHGATRRAVEATLGSTIARDVQAALVHADTELPRESSYLESLWYKAAYLGGRDSIAVHSNPGLLFKPTHADPLWSAATMLAACADWECRLRRGSLPPALTPSGQPLCMALLPQVFGCARMPEAGCDRIHATADARHAVVYRGGGWYSLRIISEGGDGLAAAAVYAALQSLPAAAPADAATRLAVCTADAREAWAETRALLGASPQNASSLRVVDDALVALVLDEAAPPAGAARAREVLCGEAGRRWFDKPSVIVFADGQAGINFEHSPCDGAQVLACFDAVRAHAAAAGAPPAAPPPDAARPIPLFWEIDGALQARVDAAAAAYDAHVGRLDVAAFATADGGGMAWAKAHGVGLDALFQLALQLAYWRLVGKLDSVYEACSTQAFVHGRTEVVRSATAPSRALVEALGGGGAAPPAAEAGRLLREALAAHREVVRDCQAGRGHERHLLALSDVARRRGVELPIFGDGGWKRLSTSVISTSGLRSPHVASFVCGPVCAHGVGHSYLLRPDGVDLTVTSWRGTGPPADAMAREVKAALAELQRLVEATPAKPRSRL